jgi:hypothetical protein
LEYANFEQQLAPNLNGHADSTSWKKLYPDFLKEGKDLVLT